MPAWTTRDGYDLAITDNLGKARALIHGAGLHGGLRALYQGDLRTAAFGALGSLVSNARRVPAQARGRIGPFYTHFLTRTPLASYRILARPLGGRARGMSEIMDIQLEPPSARRPLPFRPEGEALYMAGRGYSRPPSRPVSPNAPVASDFRGTHGTSMRTERSERARHRDLLAGTQGHHAFPKYLGGAYRQKLVDLPSDLHYLYHQELDKLLGLPRSMSRRAYDQLSVGQTIGILKKLMSHARQFDKRYKTDILPALRAGIKGAKPLFGRRLSNEPPRPRTRPARPARPARPRTR